MKRQKTPASPLGEKLRTFARAYAAGGQRERAEGLLQAAQTVDAEIAGTTTGMVDDPIVQALLAAVQAVTRAAEQVTEAAADLASMSADTRVTGTRSPTPARLGLQTRAPAPARQDFSFEVSPEEVAVRVGDEKLGKCERALLRVLAQRAPASTSRAQLAILSGYSARSSSFANGLGRLRSLGLASGSGDTLLPTEDGKRVAIDADPLPTGWALVHYWMARLSKCESALLQVLVDAYPRELPRERLAEIAGYSVTSSSFANALGRLRTLELVEGLRAATALMESVKGEGRP